MSYQKEAAEGMAFVHSVVDDQRVHATNLRILDVASVPVVRCGDSGKSVFTDLFYWLEIMDKINWN
jgi:hypothetical protein